MGAILALALAVAPVPAGAVEPSAFSLNRGWPDLGRAINGSLGAGMLNPAAVSQSQRFVGGVAGDYAPPTGDFGVHAGLADSQTSSMGGEAVYSLLRHSDANPGPYGNSVSHPADMCHRLNFALSEFYGEMVHVGIHAGLDIPNSNGDRKKARWSYGLGLIVPLGEVLRVGVESGDWFDNDKSPFQFGHVGTGLAILASDWVALVGDYQFRWRHRLAPEGKAHSAGGGVGLRYKDIIEWRGGYRWNPYEDGHVLATAIQGVRFPWIFGADARYAFGHEAGVGVTIARAMFVDANEESGSDTSGDE